MTLPSQLSSRTISGACRPAKRRFRRLGLVLLSLLVVVIVGMSAYTISARACVPPDLSHGGLACDVPVPASAAFQQKVRTPYRNGEGSGTQDMWTFSISPSDLDGVSAYYLRRLPAAGWRCVAQESGFISGWSDGDWLHPPRHLVVWIPGASIEAILTIAVVTYSAGGPPVQC